MVFKICGKGSAPEEVKEIKARNDKIIGLMSLVAGVALAALACVLVSGLLGTNMYFLGAGLGVMSLIPFIIGAYKLLSSYAPPKSTGRSPKPVVTDNSSTVTKI